MDYKIFRYCQHDQSLDCGGIILALNIDDAMNKLFKKYGEDINDDEMELWEWKDDDCYDVNNPQILEIY